MLQDTGDGAPERIHQVLCLSQWQHFVDCIEIDSVLPGHRKPSTFLSLTFLSEIESCPLKEWACDSSCIFLLMFINWRLEYLLHGDTSRRCYNLYNFYQYFITLLILYIHFTLCSKLVYLLIARFQRAVLYVLYCVLFSTWAFLFFFNACSLNLVLGYTVVIL